MSTGQYTEVERLKLEALDARVELAQTHLRLIHMERDAVITAAAARDGGKPASKPTAKVRKLAAVGPTAAKRSRGGWPKGKPRGKRKPAVEAIAFPTDTATSEAAQ